MARPLSDVARAKMLAAATGLILEVGVSGFTIDEVARRSGVAKTTIYRHFPTRNELLVAALDGAIEVPATPDTGALPGDLIEFLETVLPIFADRVLRAVSLDIFAAAARDPELAELHQALGRSRLGPLKTMFDRGKARGEIAPDITFETAFDFIEGPVIARWIIDPESLDDFDIAGAVDRVLIALGP